MNFFLLSLSWPLATTTLVTGLSTTISTTRSCLTTSHGGCTTSLFSLQTFFLFFSLSLSRSPFHPQQAFTISTAGLTLSSYASQPSPPHQVVRSISISSSFPSHFHYFE
jgi:hypothetical protein